MAPSTRKFQPMLEDVRLIWKNFAGTEKQFNTKGNREVTVRLNGLVDRDGNSWYERLKELGYNVKEKAPNERYPDEEPLQFLTITVSYKEGNRPPKIIMITSRGRTELDEESVAALDFAYIRTADIIINPYNWNVQGNSGVKAYLEAAYITIEENELDLKYADIDDSGDPSGMVRFDD